MPKPNEPLIIPYFTTGLYTHRSQLYSPNRSVGINVVSYHDAAIDGQNMELTNLLEWVRRPGFSRYCSQQFGVSEFPLQFYSIRQPGGTIVNFVDTNQNFSTFNTTTITPLTPKSTANQGFIQQVGQTTYYTNGIDQKKWDGTNLTGWGIQGPGGEPVLTGTGVGQFWQPNTGFVTPYIILDYNGNFQRLTTAGTTASSVPIWGSTLGLITSDGTAQWTNSGPYGGWNPATAYMLGTVIVDSNQNIQEVTTAGTSGTANPSWAVSIGSTTTDGTVVWTMRGIGFSSPVTSTAALYPGTAITTGSGEAWFTPNNIKVADGSVSNVIFSTTSSSQKLQGTNFSAGIAGGASITGVMAEINAKTTTVLGGIPGAYKVQMLLGGVASGTIRSISPGTTFSVFTLGGSSDTWSNVLTPVVTNDVAWGIQVTTSATIPDDIGSVIPAIDFIRLTIFYIAPGSITLGTGQIYAQSGYSYVACYHTTSRQVSTASPPTLSTGPILGQFTNTFTVPASPVPECDKIQLYRTADGGGIYYLLQEVDNPGTGLVTFTDNANPDQNLQTGFIAPLDHLNDPPPLGMTMLAYWQGRMWGVVGNKVYFNAGVDCINGVPEESWPPANVFSYPGPGYSLSPTSQGLLVWGADYISMALGGPQTLSFYPYDLMKNFGISSPNCIDQDGDTISVLNTAGQCFTLDMSGKSETGNYVTEVINASFSPATAYLTFHRNGQDSGLWLSDNSANALRFSLNLGAWSTEYAIVGGIGALASIETAPGIQSLLMGRTTGGGYILARDLTTWQDDAVNFPNCFVTIGNIVLSGPGATLVPLQHIVLYCDAAGLGPSGPTVPSVAILPNEVSANPPASFISLTNPVSEYTTANFSSSSLLSMRWPVDSMNSLLGSQLMHHLQVRVSYAPENAPNSVKAMALMFSKDA